MYDSYECAVPPLVSPTNPVVRYREEPPMCNPCLPACPKPRCYAYEIEYPCCHAHQRANTPFSSHPHHSPHRHYSPHRHFSPHRHHSPSYHHPDHHHHSHHSPERHHSHGCCSPHIAPSCTPVRTKYVIPCYRYEDGRIERYVPTRHGTLPKSVYARNGMQDQIHGYRGAQRFVCACETSEGVFVNTLVEPIRPLFPRITEEVWPGKRKKPK